MLSHDRSQIQLSLYQIWNKKQTQNAENLHHKNTVKQCVLEISFKLGNFASQLFQRSACGEIRSVEFAKTAS